MWRVEWWSCDTVYPTVVIRKYLILIHFSTFPCSSTVHLLPLDFQCLRGSCLPLAICSEVHLELLKDTDFSVARVVVTVWRRRQVRLVCTIWNNSLVVFESSSCFYSVHRKFSVMVHPKSICMQPSYSYTFEKSTGVCIVGRRCLLVFVEVGTFPHFTSLSLIWRLQFCWAHWSVCFFHNFTNRAVNTIDTFASQTISTFTESQFMDACLATLVSLGTYDCMMAKTLLYLLKSVLARICINVIVQEAVHTCGIEVDCIW